MIQAVVSRLAGQSTTIKGWCVTVTAALLGFGTTQTSAVVALIALYVIAAFAVLDAYYLALERAYRKLYNQALTGAAADWTLTIDRPGPREALHALRSPATAILYGASLATATAVAIYLALR